MIKSTCLHAAILLALSLPAYANAQTTPANPAAMRDLQLALECKTLKNLAAALKALGIPDGGTLVDAPANLKAFGLPVAKMSFHTEADLGQSYALAVFAPSVTAVQVRKAAKLKYLKAEEQYVRSDKVLGGLFMYDKPGIPELSCAPTHDSLYD